VLGGRSAFEAVYLTVVILTTVGMEGPNSDAERAWGLFLMIAGVGTVIYATGQVVSFVVEGQLREMIGRRKVNENIRKLNAHDIIVGFGRMGQALCTTLTYHNRPFVLIENDPARLALAEELGYLAVAGDATDDNTLLHAGIERASGLAACLPRDADNVFVVLTAHGLGPDLHITARCEDQATNPKLRRAGADRVICPAVIGAQRASDHLLHPLVDEMVELDGAWPDLEVALVKLSRFPQAQCQQVADLHTLLGERVSVIALIRSDGTRTLRPTGTMPVGREDQVVIVGDTGSTTQVVETLTETKAA